MLILFWILISLSALSTLANIVSVAREKTPGDRIAAQIGMLVYIGCSCFMGYWAYAGLHAR